jgi:hypothetical protein
MSSYSHKSVRDATGQSTQHTVEDHEPSETGGNNFRGFLPMAVPPACTHPVQRRSIPNMPLLLAASGQIRVIGAAAQACSNFRVEPTPGGYYFVTLCTVGLTREDLVS